METMRAVLLEEVGRPLALRRVPVPQPAPGEIRVRVEACGVCRTDLHLVWGELSPPRLPLVLGHQVVGWVDALGEGVDSWRIGDRVGLAWLAGACGQCEYCREGRENLCERAEFTGMTRDGGFAEYTTARADFAYALPESEPAEQLAPLLCGGLIGFRAWRLAGGERVRRLGLYGFGSAAHILAQVARARGQSVYAFTRPGDEAAQALARALGCTWAGGSDERPPDPLDAAIVFAPVGALVPAALAAVKRGGAVVCGGIHMSDIPSFPYRLLWEERVVRSVANLTRDDGRAFLEIAPEVPVRTHVTTYPLEAAWTALEDLRTGRLVGSAVLRVASGGRGAMQSGGGE